MVSLLANDKSLTTKKIVLVSLNNMLTLPESSKQLYTGEIKKLISHVMTQYSSDQGIMKNATKIMDKLSW